METATVETRSRFHRIPAQPEAASAGPADVPVPEGEHADEIRVPPATAPEEREFREGTEVEPPPVRPEPDYPQRAAALAMPRGVQVALVPVDWLERILTRSQIETVLERRQTPKRHTHTAAVVAEAAPKPGKGNKFCAGCSTEKAVGDFYHMASAKDGYQPRCKDCQRKDATARREAAPETTSASQRGYALSGKARDTVRGRATIKKVFAYFKKHKTATARQLQHDLKMPASTVHRILARLQKKQAIARVARV